MPFREHLGLRYFYFESLENAGLKHGLFTRQGGRSGKPFQGLNLSYSVGDDRTTVTENIDLACAAIGRPRSSLYDAWLVHGADYQVAEAPRPEHEWAPQADILLTDKPAITLFLRYADCVPILIFDPRCGAMALAHAGWKGSLQDVSGKAVRGMQAEFGSQPQDMLAALGPAICVQHYTVGAELVEAVRGVFGPRADGLLQGINGATQFDLLAANRLALQDAGVGQVEESGLCTASETQDWFSHRGEGGRTGRFGVLMALDPA
jgi:hypothetical protein